MRCSGAGDGSYRSGPQVAMACLGLEACLGSPLASVPPSPLPGAERSIDLICRARRTPQRDSAGRCPRPAFWASRCGKTTAHNSHMHTCTHTYTYTPTPTLTLTHTHVASWGSRGAPERARTHPRLPRLPFPPVHGLPFSCGRRPDGVDRIVAARKGPSAIRSMGDVGPSRGPGCCAAPLHGATRWPARPMLPTTACSGRPQH